MPNILKSRLFRAIDAVNSVMRDLLAAVFACGDFAKSSRAGPRGTFRENASRTNSNQRRFRNLHLAAVLCLIPVALLFRFAAACGTADR